jgi:putative acetyltransferase
MDQKIDTIDKNEYQQVVDLWESSVRATHHFLKEEDIQYFKPLILNTYLDAVELRCIRNNEKKIVGFLGVAEQNLEMLFIHPKYRGKKIGKNLLNYSITNLNVTKVDVNEQNEQAIGFYKYFGFEVIDRSELDFTGKPYPILHMALKNKTSDFN